MDQHALKLQMVIGRFETEDVSTFPIVYCLKTVDVIPRYICLQPGYKPELLSLTKVCQIILTVVLEYSVCLYRMIGKIDVK